MGIRILEKEEKMATLTLNRPDKLNALAGTCARKYWRHLRMLARTRMYVRLSLPVQGRPSSAGGDVNEFVAGTSQIMAREDFQ